MTRTLILVAIVGFFLSIASFGIALNLAGGPEALHKWPDAPWNKSGHWDSEGEWHNNGGRHGARVDGAGPATTRELTWDGSSNLDLDVPADVIYTQGPVAKVTVSGPKGSVDRVEIHNGQIRFNQPMFNAGRLKIVMTAPMVDAFDVSGAQTLVINGYKQDRLSIDISGSGDVTATGTTLSLDLDISGSGDAQLGQLIADEARVDVSGAGDATIAPRNEASIEVSGAGDVVLMTRPPVLHKDVSGAGKIEEKGGIEI
jgi:hypothetical protein